MVPVWDQTYIASQPRYRAISGDGDVAKYRCTSGAGATWCHT